MLVIVGNYILLEIYITINRQYSIRGCYTMKDIKKVSSGKVKYDSLTGDY